jgi:hypothetical protein
MLAESSKSNWSAVNPSCCNWATDSGRRAEAITCQPRVAKRRAQCKPMPLEQPVMRIEREELEDIRSYAIEKKVVSCQLSVKTAFLADYSIKSFCFHVHHSSVY